MRRIIMTRKAVDHFMGIAPDSKDLQIFSNGYSTEAIQSIIFGEPLSRNIYRSIFPSVEEKQSGELLFQQQFKGLHILQKRFTLPFAYFISFEPASFQTAHFVFGVVSDHYILVIDPTGKSPPDGMCRELAILQKEYKRPVILSKTKIQKDPISLVSCGPICVELMRHFQQLEAKKMQSILQSIDPGKNFKKIQSTG